MVAMQKKPLVVIVQRILPHYRLPFFRLLSKSNPDINIQVYHGDFIASTQNLSGFESQYFKNYSFSILGFSFVFQPALMMNVINKSPDLLIIEGTYGVLTNALLLIFRKILHLPTIYWTAGWDNPAITGRRIKIKNLFINFLLHLCDGAIVYGSSALEYLTNHGLSEAKIQIAQNTIDVETIIKEQLVWKQRGNEIRQRLKIIDHDLLVYTGHLAPIKRVDVLLKAYHLLRLRRENLGLLIVGNDQAVGGLKQYIEVNHVPDVFFIGEVIEGVEAYFAAGDIFVMPGTGGLALNQAMAFGLPVIATVADGTQFDLIDPGMNGFIVPVDDVDALARSIDEILLSRDRRESMGKKSLEIIQERATLRNMVDQYSKAIQFHRLKASMNIKRRNDGF